MKFIVSSLKLLKSLQALSGVIGSKNTLPILTEGLKGIAGLIEIGTITIESGSDMGEVHLSIKDGRIGILVLVEMEYIGMNQIDARVLHPRFTGRTLPGTVLLGSGSRHGQEKHKHQEIYSLFHLIQPSYSNLQSR